MITWSTKKYSSHCGIPLGKVTSPWAPFCPLNWKCYGPNMVQLKSDVTKITYCIWEQHVAMYKTSILPPEHMKILQWSFFKWLLEKETDIALIVVTLWSSMPLLEPPLSFKLAKLGPLMVKIWSTWNLILWKWLTIYRTSTLPCLRPAFCHKKKQNEYS